MVISSKTKMICLILVVLFSLSVIVSLFYQNRQLQKQLNRYSDFGYVRSEMEDFKTHVDSWDKLGPWSLKIRRLTAIMVRLI